MTQMALETYYSTDGCKHGDKTVLNFYMNNHAELLVNGDKKYFHRKSNSNNFRRYEIGKR